MKDFARLYNHERLGQVVVMVDADDNLDPAICIFVRPGSEYFGTLQARMVFTDSDEDVAHDKMWQAFGKLTEEDILKFAERTFSPLLDAEEEVTKHES